MVLNFLVELGCAYQVKDWYGLTVRIRICAEQMISQFFVINQKLYWNR